MRRGGGARARLTDSIDGADRPTTRSASLASAAAALDAELGEAAIDERIALILRACAHGAGATLRAFCDVVEDPAQDAREAPALALLADEDTVERALRAATWAMTAQRLGAAWPRDFHAMLELARRAMQLGDRSFEHMQNLGALTACANTTEASTRATANACSSAASRSST